MRDLLYGGLLVLLSCALVVPPLLARDPLWERLPWDERLGVNWYERLAERGDAEAQLRLGLLYEEGVGVEPDPAAARRWYAAAAEQGDQRAQWRLARLLRSEDPVAAAQWYRAAAQQGSAEAAFNLAVMTENGQGVALDLEAAAELYERAFAGGLAEAALNRGLLALKGVDPDAVTALAWLLRAEAAGVTQADAVAAAVAADLDEEQRRAAEALAEQ